MRLTLVRKWYDSARTIGELWLGDKLEFFTLEHTTLKPPMGFYHMVPHDSSRFGKTWALVGRDVSHFPEPGIARNAIIFHRGNSEEDTTGCILVGESIKVLDNEAIVSASVIAMERMRTLLGASDHYLTIRGG